MKILIIKTGALGDVVMATSLIKQIKDYHAKTPVWLLTSPPFESLFANWSGLNIKTFPRKGLMASLNTVRWIRKEKFSHIYDLQSSDRTMLLCALSGVHHCVGNHPHFPYRIHPKDKYTGQCHIVERMLDVISIAGIPASHQPPYLPASEQEKNKIQHWLKIKKLADTPFVILHAGSSPAHESKRWPYYHELGKILAEKGFQIIWVGTDDDAELNAQLSKDTGINATNEFSIIELAELGRHAKFAITNDSGPMHILSCSEIPVYAFFGPSNWQRNHAIGQRDRVFCPALLNKGPASETQDLKQISPAHVIARLDKDSLL